jgi:CRP-like cAMP-binding protein
LPSRDPQGAAGIVTISKLFRSFWRARLGEVTGLRTSELKGVRTKRGGEAIAAYVAGFPRPALTTMTMIDKSRYLRTTKLLSSVPADLLRRIASEMEEFPAAAGRVVCREGEPGDALYFIAEGELRVEKEGKTIVCLHPPECVGEIALIDDLPRSATVVAEQDSVLLKWDRHCFIKALSESAEVKNGIFKMLTFRLREDGFRQVMEAVERERLRQDLRRAHEIQMAMLPGRELRDEHLEIHGCCRPADQVGGDYFDYCPLEGSKTALILGDATGHGFYSGLFVAMAKSCLHNQLRTDHAPSRVMEAMNRTLSLTLHAFRLMSCCFIVFDPAAGTMAYCNAGHPAPFLFSRRTRRLQRLAPTDTVLGMPNAEDSEFSNHNAEWHPGDTLLLYSDGITEARNSGDEEFGRRRLEEILLRSIDESPQRIMESILDAVSRHSEQRSQDDDITIVVARAL